MDWETLLKGLENDFLKFLVEACITGVTGMAMRWFDEQQSKVKLSRVQMMAAMQVKKFMQTMAKDDRIKWAKPLAVATLAKEFPRINKDILDAAIEAAVAEWKRDLPLHQDPTEPISAPTAPSITEGPHA
jgi:hypothetical protein